MMPYPPPPAGSEQASSELPESTSEAADENEPDVEPELIVTTGNKVTGCRIRRYLGVVRGIVVRSPSIGQSFLGGLNQLVGGNIETYAEVCEAARQEAFERMVTHAIEMNADAVIGMRYDATEFTESVTEVLAYGTAVALTRKTASSDAPQSQAVAVSTPRPVKKRARVPDDDPLKCLNCGASIPQEQSKCPACGWSYDAGV
jgi:uncharacterized protein YbjQ (UPF0145 family)